VATNSDEYFSTLGERKNNSQRSKKVLRFDEELPAGFLQFCRDLWFAGSEKENYS